MVKRVAFVVSVSAVAVLMADEADGGISRYGLSSSRPAEDSLAGRERESHPVGNGWFGADAKEAFRHGAQAVTTNRAGEMLDECEGRLPATNRPIRIMQYNIRSAVGMDNVRNPVRTAMRIMSESPDFACLNEVRGRGQCDELARLAGMRGAYADVGRFSNAVLSREAPLRTEVVELPCGKWRRSLLICEFRDFVVASTHLDVENEKTRLASVPIIRAALEKYGKPFFVAGDWNAQPGTSVLAAMREFATVITPESGVLTLHRGRYDRKTCVIDYIAMGGVGSENFKVLGSYAVRDYMTSDHAPVAAIVAVNPGGNTGKKGEKKK